MGFFLTSYRILTFWAKDFDFRAESCLHIAKALAKSVKEFKKAGKEVQDSIEETVKEEDKKEES